MIQACTRNANVQLKLKERETATFFIIHTPHTHTTLVVCDADFYANTQQSSGLPFFHPPSPLQGGVIFGSGWEMCQ